LSAELSPNIREVVKELEIEASKAFVNKQYQKAENLYDIIDKLIIEKQNIENRRIHRGAPLHMKGLALLLKKDYKNALINFILAYITDTVNVPLGEEDKSDKLPAHNALNTFFKVDNIYLTYIKEISRKNYTDRNTPFEPNSILDIFMEKKKLSIDEILSIAKYIPTEKDILKIQFPSTYTLYFFDSSEKKMPINQQKTTEILKRLLETPDEVRYLLPDVFSKQEINIINIITDDYYLVVFLDKKGWELARKFSARKISPFPGLIKPREITASSNFSMSNSRNNVIENTKVIDNYAFSLGEDSTIIIKNFRQISTSLELSYDYTISLAYLIIFGDEIIKENYLNYLEDLVAYSIKIWRT